MLRRLALAIGTAMVVALSSGAVAEAAAPPQSSLSTPSGSRTYVTYPLPTPYHWNYTYKPHGFYVQYGPVLRLRYIHWAWYHRYTAKGTALLRACAAAGCQSLGRHRFYLYRMRRATGSYTHHIHYYTRLNIYGSEPIVHSWRWSWAYAMWVQL